MNLSYFNGIRFNECELLIDINLNQAQYYIIRTIVYKFYFTGKVDFDSKQVT